VIFDTNAVSAFADADAAVLRQLRPSAGVHLPVIFPGEYRYGVKSSCQWAAREKWLDNLESSCTVLDITAETSRVYAEIRHELRLAGKSIPENDLRVAALVRQRRLSLLSMMTTSIRPCASND